MRYNVSELLKMGAFYDIFFCQRGNADFRIFRLWQGDRSPVWCRSFTPNPGANQGRRGGLYQTAALENVVQRPYKGIIDPKRPLNLHVNGSYVKDGGYVHEMLDIGFENDSTGEGGSMWQWSDGYYQCGGRFQFNLKKIVR
jgi:hypothetical protein